MAATNRSRPKTPISFAFPQSVTVKCLPRKINRLDWPLTHRQGLLDWWDQKTISNAAALTAGAGGLGSNLGQILAQMGFGRLDFADMDLVEDSNRNRQNFTAEDVGQPKTHALVKRLERFATHRAVLRGFWMPFEQLAKRPRLPHYHVICCGVDDIGTMINVARFGLQNGTPVVFINVSEDGDAMRLFIQRSGEACFGCYKPKALEVQRQRRGCAPVPAIADILHVAVGFAARAAVGEVLGLPIGDYNCRDLTLSGFDIKKTVERNPHCPLCSGVGNAAA